jgi:hypothetical protein
MKRYFVYFFERLVGEIFFVCNSVGAVVPSEWCDGGTACQ